MEKFLRELTASPIKHNDIFLAVNLYPMFHHNPRPREHFESRSGGVLNIFFADQVRIVEATEVRHWQLLITPHDAYFVLHVI